MNLYCSFHDFLWIFMYFYNLGFQETCEMFCFCFCFWGCFFFLWSVKCGVLFCFFLLWFERVSWKFWEVELTKLEYSVHFWFLRYFGYWKCHWEVASHLKRFSFWHFYQWIVKFMLSFHFAETIEYNNNIPVLSHIVGSGG